MATAIEKSCDSQFSEQERSPNSDWPLDELTDYAKTAHTSIKDDEESLAAAYWRLGHALTLAKRHFGRGQWGKYLAECGIDKTRSSKSMAIYRTFPEITGLAGKSVDAAYKERKRKKGKRGSNSSADSQLGSSDVHKPSEDQEATLRTFLVQLREDAEHWVHEASFVAQADTAQLIELVEQSMSVLQEIHHSLQEQATES